MREREIWELSESHSGNFISQLQAVLGPEFGEAGKWNRGELGFISARRRAGYRNRNTWHYVKAGIRNSRLVRRVSRPGRECTSRLKGGGPLLAERRFLRT
jgi:hypothetical protein